MSSKLSTVLYVLVMVAIIIGLDLTLLRDHFWARLATNIGVVAVFVAVYFIFLRRR
jgi:hypothetical protein